MAAGRMAVVVLLAAGATVMGRATPPDEARPAPPVVLADPTLRGRLIDEGGNPVAGALVKLYSGMGTRFLAQTRTTAPDGTFVFEPVIAARGFAGGAGSFGLVVEHPLLARADGRVWEEIAVRRGESLVRDITMTRAGWTEVRVIDAVGHEGASLDIKLITEEGQVRYATCGGDGVFVVTGLRPGRYRVVENNPVRRFPALGEITVTPGELIRATLRHPDEVRARPENGKHAN